MNPFLTSTDLAVRADAFKLLDTCLEKFVYIHFYIFALWKYICRYRTAPETRETEKELRLILKECAEIIQQSYNALLERIVSMGASFVSDPATVGQFFRCLYPLTSLFHTLTSLDIPQLFFDHIIEWMNYFATILNIPTETKTDEVCSHLVFSSHFLRLMLMKTEHY